MKKILIVTNLKSGGVEKFIKELMNGIDPGECELHLAVPYAEDWTEFYESFAKNWGAVIKKLGGKREERAYTKKEVILKRIRYWKYLKEQNFDTVYINVGGAGAIQVIETLMARWCRVPNILVHIHTTRLTAAVEEKNTRLKLLAHNVLKHFWPKSGVTYLACSKAASEWCFPKIAAMENYEFIPNAVDAAQYQYDPEKRDMLRIKYGIRNEMVVLNVGRLSPPKKPLFHY